MTGFSRWEGTVASTICAFTPDRQELYRFEGAPDAWTRIMQGGWIDQLYGGKFGLFATSWQQELGHHVRWRLPGDGGWQPIGPSGATFAVTAESVYRLTPNRRAVFRYDGPGSSVSSWTRVGGAAGWLYGGTFGLFATHPTTGQLFQYLDRPDEWVFRGDTGAEFAVTADAIYGMPSNRQAVYQYERGTASSWIRVGGPASRLYGGDWGLLATSPMNGNLFRYLDSPDEWEHIGGPGATFAVTGRTVFGLTPNRGGVFQYQLFDTSWRRVGGPADDIVAYEER